jgi:cytochrome c oxidase cbb3-type subunit 3
MKRINKSIKLIAATTVLLFMQFTSFAQTVATEATKPDVVQIPKMFFDPITYIWILLGFIVLLTIYTMSHTIRALTKIVEGKYAPAGSTQTESSEVVPEIVRPSLYSRIMHSLVKAVPIEKEKDVMLDHNYDGIQELDNQLPPWWKYGFYITIVFAFVYLFNFHVSGSGKLQLAEYNEEMQNAELAKKQRIENDANYITSASVVKLTEPVSLAAGKAIYIQNCKACHGDFGQGNVGPNLTDEFWIHGGGIKNVFNVVTDGVPSKGMISWKSQLTPKAIQEVSSYILTLQGTNPATPKEPQGEKWVEVTDSAVVADSVAVDSVQSIALSIK